LEEYKSTYPLIHNKIISPNYVTPLLRRGRLLDWLHERSDARALVIAAEAGYGKTTLLWQWEREVEFPCYWYKLDRNDRDWTLHVSYLVEAVSQRHPGFGRRAHSVLRQMGGPGSSRPGVTAFLLAEMHERLTEPCTFIIDDWQYVAKVTEVRGLWNQILRDAPPTCRFVFASRGKPQLQFARFKTHGGYGELRTDDLRLTEQEIAELFRDVYRDPLTEDEVAELEHRTEGWAASLQLVEVSLRERTTPEERRALIESITATKDSDLFAFLAEEVLEQQGEETRNFLMSTSILQQITPELAERLTGVQDGARRLLQLEHAGLFTYRLDESRYRYHGLFRDFLERRLVEERSDAEVTGLHIHAASYYETTAQWPLAIDHYLRAGLLPQAARLIARFGEDVVSEGRIGLVDEWLQELPEKAIHDNARLSLLHGEALGIRGDWTRSLAALQRAHEYFARKGDHRMQALALLKQSSVYNSQGDPVESALLAQRGLELASDVDPVLQLRLSGNLLVTSSWLSEPLPGLEQPLLKLIADATTRGLDHYAAIGLHNLGVLYRELGDLNASANALETAARYWRQVPGNPFGDAYELVQTLLLLGNVDRARSHAQMAVGYTRSWPRSYTEALCASAAIENYQGEFRSAVDLLRPVLTGPDLGPASEHAADLLLESFVLGRTPAEPAKQTINWIRGRHGDPRLEPVTLAACAVAEHALGACVPDCTAVAREVSGRWRSRGATLMALLCDLRLAAARLDHSPDAAPEVLEALREALDRRILSGVRWWVRELARHAEILFTDSLSLQLLMQLVDFDPTHWRSVGAEALPRFGVAQRQPLLAALLRHGDRSLPEALARIPGRDVAAARATAITRLAQRIHVRTFGALVIHKGGWLSDGVGVTRRRQGHLLSLLAAHAGSSITREQVLDALWPDADPDSAVNSLNQSVFQLRRILDPDYRDGCSAPYVVSTLDSVGLNPDLVRTDLQEIRKRKGVLVLESGNQRRQIDEILDFLRGDYLAQVRYEDWAEPIRGRVNAEMADLLYPLLKSVDPRQGIRVAHALIGLDPWDEVAHQTLWEHLAATGRRTTARRAAEDFVARYTAEYGEPPPKILREAANRAGASGI
jgi:DNA-binding SARP family transcriptional activator/tetratricopeptide (TPR) repeat protein